MHKKVQIAPSLLSANYAYLAQQMQMIEKAGAQRWHIDIMDGHFVPNLSIGPGVIRDIRSVSSLPFDVHLMVEKPSRFLEQSLEAGADTLTFHVEVQEDIEELLRFIRRKNKKAGLSLSPKTSVSKIIPFIPFLDFILVMSVEPGAGGQNFIPSSLEKIVEIKDLIKNKNILMCVDGGINDQTAPACQLAGADILVSGSYIFKSDNPKLAINRLRD